MRDSIQGDSHYFLILFAQLVNKFYLKKLGSYTYYVILSISQLAILVIVMSQFYTSLQLTTILSKSINKLATFFTLSANKQESSMKYFIFVKTTIFLLNFQVIIVLIAFLQATKSKIICNKYIQKYFYFVFNLIILISLPIIYFSIYQLKNVSFSSTIYENILDSFNLISSMMFIYAADTFAISVECKYSQASIFRIYKNQNGSLKNIKIAISYVFVVLQDNTRAYWLFLVTMLVILHLVELKNIFKCRKYMNGILQRISELITLAWLTCLFVMTLAIFIPNPIILANLGSISISIFILSHCSSKIYLNNKRKYALLAGQNALKNEDAAISYALELIYSLPPEKHNQNSVKSLYKALSIQNHRLRCQNIECICQNTLFLENKQKLMKKLTEESLQQICRKFPYSFCLKFINIGFRLSHSSKIININQQISQFIKRKNVKNLTFEEKYIMIQTQQIIKHRFQEYNRIQNHIKCQNIFVEESIKADTKLVLQKLIKTIIEKNKLLLLQIYNLNAVEIFSIEINELICQIQYIWKKICQINSFNHQLYRLFIFYYQNVIPSQIEGKQITKQIMEKLDKLKHMKGFSKDVINKYIYSRKSCVLQSNLEESFGVITNVSRYCQEVLGLRREQVINTNINDIMPEYFAKSHQESMQSWLQNCTVSHYNTDATEFGYVDVNQTCFQGFLLMKVLPGLKNLLYYSVIIRQNQNDYLLLNSCMQIQGIGKRLIKEGVFTSQHIKHVMTEYTAFNFNKKLQNNTKTRRKIFLKNIHSNKNLDNMTDSCIQSSRNIDKSKFKYDCTVLISKHTISKDAYYLIKFENVTKWVSSSSEFIKQLKFGSGKFHEDDNRTVITMKYIDDELIAADDYESVEPVTNNVRFTQLLNLSVRNSSISSSGSNEAAFYNHFIKNVKKKLINPSLIPLVFFKKISVVFLIFSTLLVVEFFSLRTLFVVGFGSFNDAMFGDGSVSDNNQILEIMYNDVMMSKVYCQVEPSSSRCEYMINSTVDISNILYNLYLDGIKVYLQNRTALSGLKYYASYDIIVPFVMADSTQQISTLQFMEYYYATIRKQLDQIIAGRGSSKYGQDAMTILLNNWQTMKFINHNAIYFYLDAGEKELQMLRDYLFILGGGLFICIVALGIGLKKYQDQFIAKKVEILSIHSYINNQLLRDLTDYYIYLKQIVIDIKFIPQQFEKTIQQEHQEFRKDMKYNQNKTYLIQIIIVILAITILAGLQILKISLVLPSSMKMVKVINNLMDSENYLLQAYFQLKTYYLTYDYNKSVDQISSEISLIINQTETRFVQVAKDSLNLFSTDSDFTNDFNILLTADVCQLTEWVFKPWQVQHCLNNFNTSVLSLGLVSSMIFFQRNTFQALNELHRRQHENINKTQYFMKDVFKDIDDSIFYMFRLYQATQARMYEGLNNSVNNSLVLLDFINVTSTIIIIAVLICWFSSFKNKQKQMSQLYGIILQLPEGIMKPQIIAKIKSNLEIQF